MLKSLILLGFLAALTACQSNQSLFVPEAIKKPGNGKVYVYWPGQRWGEKSRKSPEIQLDGVPVGLLRYKSYIELELAAGRYELRLTGESEQSNWDGLDQSFPLLLEADEVKYVRLLVKYDQTTNSLGHGKLSYAVIFLPRAASEARLEIHGLKKVSG